MTLQREKKGEKMVGQQAGDRRWREEILEVFKRWNPQSLVMLR